ncbi:MAG: FemAB family PEP-CTERM system-associated protein [Acidobacteria bacterium]|nr:FemAB family PEP-CTERM system-associated protein [Acidobacteriota bacterium]
MTGAVALPEAPLTTDGALTVTAVADADAAAWTSFVNSRPDATGYHDWPWRDVIVRTFGHEPVYLAARRDGQVAGVLPLVFIDSRIFGRSLTSLPFLNYGGVLAEDAAAGEALVSAAADLAKARGCLHVELRHIGRQFPMLPARQHKVTMLLTLQGGLWEKLDRKVRNQVRKAQKSNLVAEHGGIELVGDFYTVFTRNMRDLGTPVYARVLFEEVLRAFPDRAALHVVRHEGKPVAAGLTFRTRGTTEVPWASSIRDYNSLCPNHLLYWSIIERALELGCDTLDFGRSTPGEGTFKFKEQWGAQAVPLHWEYKLLPGAEVPNVSPTNPKYRLMIETWKRLPLGVANFLGPHIVGSIP